jgi:ankyrin repeat protein
LGFFYRSRANFRRPVPNLSVTTRNFCIAVQVALLLIEHGSELGRATATGRTALHCAVEHDQLDAVVLLLQVCARATVGEAANRIVRVWRGATENQCASNSAMLVARPGAVAA